MPLYGMGSLGCVCVAEGRETCVLVMNLCLSCWMIESWGCCYCEGLLALPTFTNVRETAGGPWGEGER